MPDKYASMTALYADWQTLRDNVWQAPEAPQWIQIVEAQSIDNPEGQTVVWRFMAASSAAQARSLACGYHPPPLFRLPIV
jgi:hypothetical protein